jgi:hypothetical protein
VPARPLLMPRWRLAVSRIRMAANNTVQSERFLTVRVMLGSLSNGRPPNYLVGTCEMELWEILERIVSVTT